MKKKATTRPASDRLLAELPRISGELVVGRLQHADPALLRELGYILDAVVRGESAHKLFRQDKRAKPRKDFSQLAFVYWYVRACSPDFAERPALERIKTYHKQLDAPPSVQYIRRIARNHRDDTLAELDRMGNSYLLFSADKSQIAACSVPRGRDLVSPDNYWREKLQLTPAKVAGLREYLRKKTEREPRPRG